MELDGKLGLNKSVREVGCLVVRDSYGAKNLVSRAAKGAKGTVLVAVALRRGRPEEAEVAAPSMPPPRLLLVELSDPRIGAMGREPHTIVAKIEVGDDALEGGFAHDAALNAHIDDVVPGHKAGGTRAVAQVEDDIGAVVAEGVAGDLQAEVGGLRRSGRRTLALLADGVDDGAGEEVVGEVARGVAWKLSNAEIENCESCSTMQCIVQ
ncbi:MAG: hypothetical protein M1818_004108 [Claussenomyces sp. TS43310]|nr:MAG: hypothetical protein M1818_004108 [Claussenomyces sp. TS43310]